MLRLVLPVENIEAMEKARPGLIFRTDLPYHTAKGELKYRKGWVKPEDSRALDRAKKQGDPSAVIGKYQYEEDMFDDGEGEAWEKPKAAEEAKPEPEAAPQPAPEPIAEAKPEPEAPAEEAKAPLYIEDLTEKAIIVRGDTRTYKAAIKMAGGKWNSKHGGWIFPKKWESNVRARLAHLLVPPKSAILTSADEPQKSVGHLGFFTVNGRRKELLEYETGGIYTADLDDVIDVRTGFRIGRWEGPAWQKDTILTRLGLKAKEAPQEAPEAKENIKEAPADAPSKQDSLPAGNSEQPSRVADRIAKPEVPDGEVAKTGDVQSDLEKPIAKMKFRDYGSWSAAGKHLLPAKRAALNQEIAELLNLPADEIEPKELDLIRQYSGFGGVKAEDERGVLYDFYTSPPVARMVWKLANKIVPLASGARVLEPSCGTGVFFDVAPQGVDLTGVEFDPRTAAAAGLLQPQARIYHASYEQFNLHEHEKFDAVVGNAPFGDRSVETQFLDESGEKSLDRYFISRSLDNLKSGGSMAMIVGPGVMDNSTSRDWRAKMLRKGQFIGAVRLPNESFKHTQTGVNPDVVMFRAYPEDVRSRLATMSDEEMKQAGFFDEAFVEGGYFEENPAHRLGRVERGRFDSEVTVGKLDPADMDRAFEQFQPRDMKGREDFDRVRSMTEGRKVAEEAPGNLTAEEAAAVAAKTLRVGMTKTVNGKVYKLNANHRWELVDTAGPTARKLDRIKEIGEVVRAIRAAMRNDEPVDDLQRQARSLIESYEKEFRSKHTDDADIQRFLKANPSVAGVYEATTVSADSDLLTKQNVYNKEIEIVDGHRPAIRALLDMQRDMMNGTVEEIRARFPNEADALIQAMWSDTDIFLDADGTFRLREDFVAGNAWEKIDALDAAIKAHPGEEYAAHRGRWQAGIEALRDAAGWVPIEDADVSPQAVWIPEEIVNRWADTYRKAPDGYRYGRNESGKWGVIAENKTSEWDFKRRTYIDREAGEWCEHNDEFVYFLNSQKQRGKYTDTDTYNKNALASFKTWLATDEQARAEIEEIYNRQFNTELGAPNKTYAVNIEGWNPNIELKPWQWQSIHHLYRQGKGISALGTGYGKAQPLDAKILTTDGWKLMGDIRVGDQVIGADGNPTKVVGVFPQGMKEIFEITFSDGGKTQACGEHLWETQSHSERAHKKPAVIRSTEDLRRSLRKNYSIPIVAPVNLAKRSYVIPPYTMGVLLGDGCFSQDKSLTVSNPEAEIEQYLAEELHDSLRLSVYDPGDKCPSIGICRKVPTGKSPYLEYLRSCGLIGKWSHEKFIPDEYLFGAIEDRIAILRGIMDTDGYVNKKGMCVQFSTSSPTLASNVATLVRSLGGLVGEFTKAPTFSYLGEKKKGMISYILTLKMPPEINPFRLPRKADRVIAKSKYIPRRYIRTIESVGNKPAQCIMVENPRHLYVTDDFILTHNTYAGIGLFALLRQEGKVHRAFFQVPNNKVKDWVEDFGKAMPGLKVGAIDPDGEGMAKQENRFAAYQKLASGDYDVIIMPETSASEIQLTEEADAAIVADYADQLASKKSEEGAAMGAPSEKEKKKTAREQQKAKDRAESSLTGGKKNATITFEEFGCDAVFADEMHRMKNLFTSSLSRETGMNDGRRSDRALSFFKKCEAVRRANDGKNVFGLTATPLTNSPLEYYNMMQHIAPEMLKAKGIASIDQFIQTFADIKDGEKFDPFSGKLKPGKVLEGFKNLKSLQDMFFRFTDLQNDPTKIGLKKPTPNNKANVLPKSDDQVAVVKQIAEDFKKFKMMTMEEREGLKLSNFTFYGRMRTASLDLELYDPEAFKGWKNPKVEQMADNALDIYNARGGGQVIFCDRVLSGDGSFNMHEKIKKALVARGFKEDEIVIVNGLTKGGGKASDSALERLVSDAIDGYNGKYDKQGNLVVTPKYKFIIGTTQTIGEGVNLQKNSSALHHVDIPYRPSDFIQRNGRIDRQGNKQSTVELHSYAAAGTIDNYSMALVSGKEGWINQLLKTKSNVFTNPNGDGYDMEEILMSLSEEWGDKAGADEKRAAIEAKKAAVIKQENIKKSGEYLKQLSLMRGALAAYQGDKGSRDYQNRLRKIDNIEAALRNNPEFHAAEILGADGVPFIYHEGTGKVVRKGDLFVNKGRVFRVSGFNHKKRTFEISSAITGQVEGEEDAFASSTDRGYNRDRSFFVDNPTPEMVDHYIAMTDPEEFHKKPVEFKRDNYVDLVNMHARDYSSKVHPIVKDNDGDIRLASYYSDSLALINPYTDEGRKEIVSALESGKMDVSSYRRMEEEYGDLGGGEKARAAQLRAFESEPKAKAAMEAMPKIRANAEGWYSLRELAEKMPVEGRYVTEYELRTLFNNHPDAETGIQSFPDGHDYAVRFKQGVQKSMHYGKMVSEGGRVYVLLERGR